MKHALLIVLLFACCACQKSKNDGPADLFNGHQLAGQWKLTRNIIKLRFQDGTEQNLDRLANPDESLEFKHTTTAAHTAKGTFTTVGFGQTSTGTWSLAQDKAALDFIYDNPGGPALYQFRIVDQLDDHKLILSANDQMVLLIYETNDLIDPTRKLAGGSIYEEYTR